MGAGFIFAGVQVSGFLCGFLQLYPAWVQDFVLHGCRISFCMGARFCGGGPLSIAQGFVVVGR
jgi:hypothetical protein